MRVSTPWLAAVSCLLAMPSLANDVIISNFSSGLGTGTAFGGTATTQYKAFGFTMGATPYALEEVILSLNVTGAMITPLLEIWSDAGGTPGSPVFTLDNPAALVGQADFTFTAGSSFTLSPGASYWVYLRSIPMAGDAFLWEGSSPATLPTGAGATALNYEFNGGISTFFNRLEVRGTSDGVGTAYCSVNSNSTGQPALLEADGSSSVGDNDVTLLASQLPQSSFGFFIVSQTQGFVMNPAGSAGNLCILGSIGRYVGAGQIQQSGATGSFSLAIDLAAIPQPTGAVAVIAGDTWNFQTWFRDSVGGSATSNFSNGLQVDFQ
ncbi:hypothetical protein Poly30_49260 [Planctomycetes bacterium Poly30]|uniref:Uncharacterized protein n=1 Tax=Saltatorellus ferox TaxID=2528018 RepID=A0A518EZ70_9BACT|nr:hypothetical protein Poly30_49260 [Planctomycetes bacterium Poly30]